MNNDIDSENRGPTGNGSLSFHPHILLAEDEPDHQLVISRMLHDVGAHVTIVENGKCAVDRALQAQEQGNPFDLILMDIQMPVMDGYLAIRRLREARYRLPVVALTAHAMVGDRQKFMEAGGDDYITKPFAESELVALIKMWTNGSRSAASA